MQKPKLTICSRPSLNPPNQPAQKLLLHRSRTLQHTLRPALPQLSRTGYHLPALAEDLTQVPGGTLPDRSALSELTDFIYLCVDGRVPTSRHAWFPSALLMGIQKPGSDKLRPVALGESNDGTRVELEI